MKLNGFTARVIEGREVSGGYVEMQHGQKYTLRFKNENRLRCDVSVEIDGKLVGEWRLGGFDLINIERPAHGEGRFTFYEVGSAEGNKAGLTKNPSMGLIKVTFKPELEVKPVPVVSNVSGTGTWVDLGIASVSYRASLSSDEPKSFAMAAGAAPYNAGGTGLSGKSNQNFYTVPPLDYDYTKFTTIYLRLVAPSNDPRPLTAYTSPIPPAV